MKIDLKNDWATICLAPYKVDANHKNKFTALLLGDELADDKEFSEMFYVGDGMNHICTGYWGDCKFCLNGSCFHPFRPGSLVDAIFSSAFRDQINGGQLVNKKACDALENRCCYGCTLCFPDNLGRTSAFYGLGMFYKNLLGNVGRGSYLYVRFEDFRKTYVDVIDKRNYFEAGPYRPFEDNVRRHFEKLMETHYNLLREAIEKDGFKEGNPRLHDAISKIKLDLVTHWSRYWAAMKYKEVEA